MKLISWNVNGLRATMGKGFLEFAKEADPGYPLHTGNENAGRTGGSAFRRVSSVLVFSREERLFRDGPCSRRKSLSVSDAGSVLRSTITRGV